MIPPAREVVGIRNWRILRVTGEKHPYRLDSFAFDTAKRAVDAGRAWDGPVSRATCLKTTGHVGGDGAVPAMRCTCGFWAVWPEHAHRFKETVAKRFGQNAGFSLPTMGPGKVLGVVEGFGRVIPGELGFRSEYAMVRALTDPFCDLPSCEKRGEITRFGSTGYGTHRERALATFCAEHSRGVGGAPLKIRAPELAVFDGVKFGARCAVYQCRYKVHRYIVGTTRGWCVRHDDRAAYWLERETSKVEGTTLGIVAIPTGEIMTALRFRYDLPMPPAA